ARVVDRDSNICHGNRLAGFIEDSNGRRARLLRDSLRHPETKLPWRSGKQRVGWRLGAFQLSVGADRQGAQEEDSDRAGTKGERAHERTRESRRDPSGKRFQAAREPAGQFAILKGPQELWCGRGMRPRGKSSAKSTLRRRR